MSYDDDEAPSLLTVAMMLWGAMAQTDATRQHADGPGSDEYDHVQCCRMLFNLWGSFGVSIGGTVHRLATTEDTFPVHTSTVAGVDGTVEYSYVELTNGGNPVKTEEFTRKFQDPSKDT
ncbi:hypothetical protein BGX29_001247 [Mortierella sp. GBA35]|nr:hypothetical protein BGX29_001247 [Mortierella sp. GBA35]